MFFDQSITFTLHNGETITGHLEGSTKLWTFKSDNEYFRSLYSSGQFSNLTMYVEITPEYSEMFDKVWEEIDKIVPIESSELNDNVE